MKNRYTRTGSLLIFMVGMSATPAFAEASSCLQDIAKNKAVYSLKLSQALKASGHLQAIAASTKIDLMCAPIQNGRHSTASIDNCFRATRHALQLFNAKSQNLFGAKTWGSLAKRMQSFKNTGMCHSVPQKFNTI